MYMYLGSTRKMDARVARRKVRMMKTEAVRKLFYLKFFKACAFHEMI
jgi:hypothetical protein